MWLTTVAEDSTPSMARIFRSMPAGVLVAKLTTRNTVSINNQGHKPRIEVKSSDGQRIKFVKHQIKHQKLADNQAGERCNLGA